MTLFTPSLPPPPLPSPDQLLSPPAIVRTTEELGIDIHPGLTHIEPPLIGERIVDVAEIVLQRYRSGHRKPTYEGIRFSAANRAGYCQQNVRNLIEAAVYEEPRSWDEAACCAAHTQSNLHHASKDGKYIEITNLDDLEPGDLVYLSGNQRCSRCGRRAGHAMVFTRRLENGDMMMWQNTSRDGLLLCEIPLADDQIDRFLAAYRFPSPRWSPSDFTIDLDVVMELINPAFRVFIQVDNMTLGEV
jgi:hypothetical protein